jgi:hypothetical protein
LQKIQSSIFFPPVVISSLALSFFGPVSGKFLMVSPEKGTEHQCNRYSADQTSEVGVRVNPGD